MEENVDQKVQLAYLNFFQGVLLFLQAYQKGEKEQHEEFKKLKGLAHEFKGYLPNPHKREGVDIEADIDRVITHAEGYYPNLETSDDLRDAVETLGNNLAKAFGVTA